MLDLFITYVNFLILSIKFIVKLLAFQPPNPQGYRIKNSKNEILKDKTSLDSGDEIEILFLIPIKKPENKEKPKIEDSKNDEFKKIKLEKKNENEITTNNNKDKKAPKYNLEYRPAKKRYADFNLIFIDNDDNNTKIPAFIFTPFIFEKNELKDNIIIYCHGNSGDIGTSFMECQILSYKLRCKVLSIEYPGYGLSDDKNNRTEKRAYYNVRQSYKYTIDILKYKPQNIILYGFSLGTGIVFDIACDDDYPIGGVILQSPFLSIVRTIYNFKKTYYFDLFNSCDKAKRCKAKIFFIHGNKDTIVPYAHGRILSSLIPKECLYNFYTVPGANHNDILKIAKEEMYLRMEEFIINCNNSYLNKTSSDIYDFSNDFGQNDNVNSVIKEKPQQEYNKKINDDNILIQPNITSYEGLIRNKENSKTNYNSDQKIFLEKSKETKNDRDSYISYDNDILEQKDINLFDNFKKENNNLNELEHFEIKKINNDNNINDNIKENNNMLSDNKNSKD